MADSKKFEEMLERLINEDHAGAEELFHEIVVQKSREIYENLLEDDLDDEAVDEAADEEVDESDEELDEADDEEVDESDEDLEEGFDLDEFEVEADPMVDPMAMGGDATDDMMGDVEMPDMDGEEEGEGDVEDRIEDLEDALEDLKAEFDALMAGDEGEEDGDMDMDMDMGDEEGDDEEGEEPEESFAYESSDEEVEESKTPKSAGEQMREYVEKVTGKMGDNGASTMSTVAKPNNMGGTTANLVKGGVSKGEGTKGGLAAPTPKDMNTKNVNVVGAKGATKLAAQTKGHGAEKRSAGDNGANTKSTIGAK
tara:strand:+ start:4621 stop:5553 length:933 start_codon:yes stop_codon:yes gene_type:complete